MYSIYVAALWPKEGRALPIPTLNPGSGPDSGPGSAPGSAPGY